MTHRYIITETNAPKEPEAGDAQTLMLEAAPSAVAGTFIPPQHGGLFYQVDSEKDAKQLGREITNWINNHDDLTPEAQTNLQRLGIEVAKLKEDMCSSLHVNQAQ